MSFAILRHNRVKSHTKGVAVAHNHRQISREKEHAFSDRDIQVGQIQAAYAGNILHGLSIGDMVFDGGRNDLSLWKDIRGDVVELEENEGAELLSADRLAPEVGGIDPKLSGLNRYFTDGKAVRRINAKLPEGRRKDAVEVLELLLTASPEFFDGLEKDRAKLAKHPVFLDWVDKTSAWAAREFGENLVDVVLHMDEQSPHMHVLTVPLTKDGRLCAKEVSSKGELIKRQSSYAEAMKPFGLERGQSADVTRREHVPLKKKAKQEALQGVVVALINVALAKEAAEAQGGLKVAQIALAKAEARATAAEQATAEAKAELLNVKSDLVKVTGNLSTAIAEAKTQATARATAEAKATATLKALEETKVDLDKMQGKFTGQQKFNTENFHLINTLQGENKNMATALKTATARDHELVAEISELRKQNAAAKPTVEQLHAVDRVLVDQARERIELEFLGKHQALPMANPGQVKYGVVKESCGLFAVLDVGRGVMVRHVFETQQELKGKSKGQGTAR